MRNTLYRFQPDLQIAPFNTTEGETLSLIAVVVTEETNYFAVSAVSIYYDHNQIRHENHKVIKSFTRLDPENNEEFNIDSVSCAMDYVHLHKEKIFAEVYEQWLIKEMSNAKTNKPQQRWNGDTSKNSPYAKLRADGYSHDSAVHVIERDNL